MLSLYSVPYFLPINPAGLNGAPQLIRDGMVLANDVEDLQLAMFYDTDDDGVVDPLGPADPPPYHSAVLSSKVLPEVSPS